MLKSVSNNFAAKTSFYALLATAGVFFVSIFMLLVHEAPYATTFPHLLFFLIATTLLLCLLFTSISFIVSTLLATNSLSESLENYRTALPQHAQKLIDKLDLKNRIFLIKSESQFCLTVGLLMPKIYLSTFMIKNLNQEELEALFLHEIYHLRNLDPLKSFTATVLKKTFFFLPVIGELAKWSTQIKELAADEFVVQKMGSKESLSRALLKALSSQPPYTLGKAAVSVSFSDGINLRLAKLVGEEMPKNTSILGSLLLTTIIVLLPLLVSMFSPKILHSSGSHTTVYSIQRTHN